MLTNVSRPSSIAVTFFAGTPCALSHALPDAASVVRSPGAPAPTVIMDGANPKSKIRLASIKRASSASPGRPSSWAAPKTTMTSALRTMGLFAARHTFDTA